MKTIAELLEGVRFNWNQKGSLNIPANSVRCDSKKVSPGDLFVAISGCQTDGHRFIPEALRGGASALVVEDFSRVPSDLNLPVIGAANTRVAFAHLTASYFDFPSRKLKLIGITGTNGKTTTAFLIQHLLGGSVRAGLIGTVCFDDGRQRENAPATTPSADILNEWFRRMNAHQLSHCVMEVSSHALDQDRTSGLQFSSAVFTNLTQDHLDYHKDFESYYRAKRKLFLEPPLPARIIVNRSDPYGVRLLEEVARNQCTASYGLDQNSNYRARDIQFGWQGVHFTLIHRGERIPVQSPLVLKHNVFNVLAALATAHGEGVAFDEILKRLADFNGVCGRMERIDEGQDFHVFVDYAHTPDAMFQVLSAARDVSSKRVITVFGAGGDRDRTKRPVMGKVANRFSDLVILTSDNPRSENPAAILDEIRSGIDSSSRHAELRVIPDRSEAIREAVEAAAEGDLVFILGKGHEPYQLIGQNRIPFSDQTCARHWIRQRCLRLKKPLKFAAEH